MPTILLADDHMMISKGLRKLLEFDFGYKDVQSVTSCSDVLVALKKKAYSHVILDIGLTDGSALEILPTVKNLYPSLNILIYSGKPANVFKRGVRQYGIHNYLSKDAQEEETMAALKNFLDHGTAFQGEDSKQETPFSGLSARMLEILPYLLKGLKPSEIALILNLQRTTVSEFRARILKKTGTTNIQELTELAAFYDVS